MNIPELVSFNEIKFSTVYYIGRHLENVLMFQALKDIVIEEYELQEGEHSLKEAEISDNGSWYSYGNTD